MDYFKNLPVTTYNFGDETIPTIFRNIGVYASVVDEVKNSNSFYNDYYIKEFERPDQLSQKLYGTPNYHWTFYLMNDKLRERGWPLTNRELIEKAQKDYSKTTLTTQTPLFDKFKIGQVIEGTSSAVTATIDHRHLDLGQIVVSGVTGSFIDGEIITSTNVNGVVETITLSSSSLEYLSVHHYENSAGEYVDIDPSVGPGAFDLPITYLDRYNTANDEIKTIRVLKPSVIVDVVTAFKEAIRI